MTATGDMRVVGVPVRVWEFTVSGYPVFHRWLRARRGQALNARMHRTVLELVARIDQLLYLFDEADVLLEESMEASLSFGPHWRQAPGAVGSEGEDAEPAT